MGWRLRDRAHHRVSYSGPARASYNEARMTPLTLAAADHAGSHGPHRAGRADLDLPRLLGHDRQRLRHPGAAPRAADPGQRDRARPSRPRQPRPSPRCPGPELARAGGRQLRPRIPGRDPAHHGDREVAAAVSGRRRRRGPGRGRRGDHQLVNEPGHLHARRDRGADQRPGGVGRRAGRLPGHGAPHAWRCCAPRGCPPGTSPATCTPTPRRSPAARGRRAEPRLGRVLGRRMGPAATRPAGAGSASGTWWSARGRDYADVSPLKGIYHGAPERRDGR